MMVWLLSLVVLARAAEVPAPVSALTEVIKTHSDAAVNDVGRRLVDQIWSGHYASPEASKDAALHNQLADAVRQWIKEHVQAGRADAVARLYYVVGAGDAPPKWALEKVPASSLAGFRTDEWFKRMRQWTESVPQGKGALQPGRLEPQIASRWPAAFLDDAAAQAERLARPAPKERDATLDRLGDDLSASREPARGELRRFKNARELASPPIPKLNDIVPDPIKTVTAPVLKSVDAVTQEGIVKPIDAATQSK